MTLESLLTLRITSDKSDLASAQALAGQAGAAQQGGEGMFDWFLAQVETTDTPVTQEQGLSLNAEQQLSDNNPTLEISRILAANEDIKKEAEAYDAILGDSLPQVLALNKIAFDEILKPHQTTEVQLSHDKKDDHALPQIQDIDLKDIYMLENQSQELQNKVKAILNKIESISQGGQPQLLATNLTPDDLATLQRLANKIATQEIENNGKLTLTTAQGTPDATTSGAYSDTIPTPTDDLPARAKDTLNALINITQDKDAKTSQNTNPDSNAQKSKDVAEQHAHARALNESQQAAQTATHNTTKTQNSITQIITEPFKSTMITPMGSSNRSHNAKDLNKLEPGSSDSTNNVTKSVNPQNVKAEIADPVKPVTPNAQNGATTALPSGFFEGMESSSLVWGDGSSMGLLSSDTSPLDTGYGAYQSLTTQTSISMQAAQAGQSHPATQMVALNIKNNVGKGQDRQISMQLEPADLGRIDIDMRFAKDKSMKAMLTVEKPETLAMVKRDAHILERALHDAGIEVDTNTISFDLADEGYDFNHNGQHDDHGPQGKSPDGSDGQDDEEMMMIETTMDWRIDPITGHTHYNILA